MLNQAVMSKSLISAIEMLIDKKISSYNFITLGKVVSVNSNFTINAQPLASDVITGKFGEKTTRNPPVIQNIPFLLTSIPKKNDFCLLLHLDKVSTTTRKNIIKSVSQETGATIKYVKSTPKAHSLNNCVAICGFSNILEDEEDKPFEDTPSQQNQMLFTQQYIGNIIYPIGSIYISINDTDPKYLFGGEWVQVKDRFLLASGDKYSLLDTNGNNIEDGSADAVVVEHGGHLFETEQEIFYTDNNNAGTDKMYIGSDKLYQADTTTEHGRGWNVWMGNEVYPAGKSTGESGTSKNMPPYLTVCMWIRTKLADTYPPKPTEK